MYRLFVFWVTFKKYIVSLFDMKRVHEYCYEVTEVHRDNIPITHIFYLTFVTGTYSVF